MILLLSVSPVGQAGVKRLHLTLRRIRRYEPRSGSFALLNRQDLDLSSAFTALPFSKRRQLRNPGLKNKPMYNRGKFHSRLLAASRNGTCTSSLATAVSEFPHVKPQSPGTFFLKEIPVSETPQGHAELFTCFGRNSICFTVSSSPAPAAEALGKRPIAIVCAFPEPCFSRVARQPQQPVVQALKKI